MLKSKLIVLIVLVFGSMFPPVNASQPVDGGFIASDAYASVLVGRWYSTFSFIEPTRNLKTRQHVLTEFRGDGSFSVRIVTPTRAGSKTTRSSGTYSLIDGVLSLNHTSSNGRVLDPAKHKSESCRIQVMVSDGRMRCVYTLNRFGVAELSAFFAKVDKAFRFPPKDNYL